MNIVIMGAGAIGSFIGATLSKNNKVILVGRNPHIAAIQKKGLEIKGETVFKGKISAVTSVDEISFIPDIVFLTVKAYDTANAMDEILPILSRETILCSLQNGLDNIEKISGKINLDQIVAGVTSRGVELRKPGVIYHTGIGWTIVGTLKDTIREKAEFIAGVLNKSGIETSVTSDIMKEIWKKAIINSSINPLTAIFSCRNGYLLENPILAGILDRICRESTSVANAAGIPLNEEDLVDLTHRVIENTAGNSSSMLQSMRRGKKTEIDSINGKIVEIGEKKGVDPVLNKILLYLIKNII